MERDASAIIACTHCVSSCACACACAYREAVGPSRGNSSKCRVIIYYYYYEQTISSHSQESPSLSFYRTAWLLFIAHARTHLYTLVDMCNDHFVIFFVFPRSLRERGRCLLGNPAERRDADEADRFQLHPDVHAKGDRFVARSGHAMARPAQSHNRVSKVSLDRQSSFFFFPPPSSRVRDILFEAMQETSSDTPITVCPSLFINAIGNRRWLTIERLD